MPAAPVPSDRGAGARPARAALLSAVDRALRTGSAQSVLHSQVIADRLGMNSTDLECLDILNLHGPITAGRLAELSGLTTGSVTALIDRMERGGFVRREPDPRDRRRVIVRLLPERVQELAPLFEPLGQQMEDLLSRYSDEELALVLDFTERSNELVHHDIARLRGQAAPGRRSGRARAIEP